MPYLNEAELARLSARELGVLRNFAQATRAIAISGSKAARAAKA
ncbi:hypothetical protein [Citromicrobium bathyomarinum]